MLVIDFTQALAEAKKTIEELEKKLLENVPIDTAKEIGAYQEKMVSEESIASVYGCLTDRHLYYNINN